MEYLQILISQGELGLRILYVLNLIINGIPSIHSEILKLEEMEVVVLNLIINGIPSIHK